MKLILCFLTLMIPLFAQELSQDIAAKRAYYQKERSELMAMQKANESALHKQRIAILERAEQCIQAAKTKEAYRACEEKEKAEREAFQKAEKRQKEEAHAKAETLKKQHEEDKQALKAKREVQKNIQ